MERPRPSVDPEVLESESALVSKAADYEALCQTAAWTRLLDWLEARAEDRLVRLRASLSSDPLLIAQMVRDWRGAEQTLTDLQNEVLGTIEEARELSLTLEKMYVQ